MLLAHTTIPDLYRFLFAENGNQSAAQVARVFISLNKSSPRGLMDKASVSEAEDCGFESRRGYGR